MMPDREDQQRCEAAGAQGIDHYAWIKGFWTYENGHWACPFEWEAPANETNRIGGHWERTPDGWVWVPGHPS